VKRLQKRVVEHVADAAGRPGRLVRRPDLSDDLILADNDRVQTAGDPHQMP